MKATEAERRRRLGRERVRRHEERAWATRSGKVFTHRMDPTQLRAEQVAKALAEDPAILTRLKPDIRELVLAQLGGEAELEPPSPAGRSPVGA